MQRVTRIQTRDGVLHETIKDAKRHADRAYGDVLLQIGREIANQNYTFVTNYIDEHMGRFATLQELKSDMLLTEDEDRDDGV